MPMKWANCIRLEPIQRDQQVIWLPNGAPQVILGSNLTTISNRVKCQAKFRQLKHQRELVLQVQLLEIHLNFRQKSRL